MRPVNLVPEKVRRRRELRDTGVVPYVIVGLIAAAVLGTLGYVLLENQVTSRKAKLDKLEQEVGSYKADAAALEPYARFAAMKQLRVQGVSLIAAGRFPWHRVLQDISLALPSDAWLTKMVGKISSDVQMSKKGSGSGSGGGGSGEEMISVPGPAVQLIGCTYGQRDVARMMTRLRNIEGVAQVLLKSSKKKIEKTAGGGGGDGDSGDDCRRNGDITMFNVTITFPPEPESVVASLIAAGAPGSASSATAQAKGTVETANQSQAAAIGGGE